MKAVNLLIESKLPEELRDFNRSYDQKSIMKLLAQVASVAPDRFADIAKQLADVGRNAAYRQGETIRLHDLAPVLDKKIVLDKMKAEVATARKLLPKEEFEEARNEIYVKYSDLLEKETITSGLAQINNIALSVGSGARGKPGQIKAMLSTPGVYTDNEGRLIPLFIENSYAEGLRPAEFLAGTFGARLSVTGAKTATARGGDQLKQAFQNSANMVVTEDDCGTSNGIELDPEDDSLRNRYTRNGDLVTKQRAAELRKEGKPVLVRSALTCQASDGVCQKCMGLKSGGKPYRIGDHVGAEAATTVYEPVVQGSLSCLHLGTRVRMADLTVKAIEDIVPGDWVLGADIQGNTFPVQVLANWDQGIQPVSCYVFEYESGACMHLNSTEEHPILKQQGSGFTKEPVGTLSNMAVLSDRTYAKHLSSIFLGNLPCRDLSVDHPDELFVLENGLIVKNTKHTAGMAKGKKQFSGLDVIERFTQSPENFKDKAAVAPAMGKVESIDKAPQGGFFITVAGQKQYVPRGQEITAKVGDMVEPGDVLSDGLVDPEDIVRLRGLGEGRKYYADRLHQILMDSSADTDKRNVEVLARAAIDHVQVTSADGFSDYLPDDIARYSRAMKKFSPSKNTIRVSPQSAVGKYLQNPVLHYTVGTKLTPRMAKHISQHVTDDEGVYVADDEPEFQPTMMRLRTSGHTADEGFIQGQIGSYLKGDIVDKAVRGADEDIESNTHFAPRLSIGVGFGDNVRTTGKF